MISDLITYVTTQKQLDDLVKENNLVIVEYVKEEPSKKYSQIALQEQYHFLADHCLLKEMKRLIVLGLELVVL